MAESLLNKPRNKPRKDLSPLEAKLKRLGWTKAEAARQLHVRVETMSRYEAKEPPFWVFRILDLEWKLRCCTSEVIKELL